MLNKQDKQCEQETQWLGFK